ncbi:MAG TPA: hypothetical protein VGX28_11595 [Frankiaceae bacterium]|jgi:hypothetical protein|nr:hypothetical protein [Frankiaceae bacterium]
MRRLATALAAAVVAAGALVATAAPASAASGECPYDRSTRLLTADDRNDRVWVYDDGWYWTRVCFRFGASVAGSLDIAKPHVNQTPNVTLERDWSAYCPDVFDVEDPVVVLLEAGLFNGRTLCVGVAGEAYAINVTFWSIDMPHIVLSLDRGTPLAATYCDVFPEAYACDVDYAEVPIL